MPEGKRMSEPRYYQVTTTTDDQDAAAALARAAVEARLAACAQVAGPITSTYWWQEKIDTAQEWTVSLKTTAEAYAALEALIRDRHSYDVPEIIRTPLTGGNPAYLDWISAEVAPTDRSA